MKEQLLTHHVAHQEAPLTNGNNSKANNLRKITTIHETVSANPKIDHD